MPSRLFDLLLRHQVKSEQLAPPRANNSFVMIALMRVADLFSLSRPVALSLTQGSTRLRTSLQRQARDQVLEGVRPFHHPRAK